MALPAVRRLVAEQWGNVPVDVHVVVLHPSLPSRAWAIGQCLEEGAAYVGVHSSDTPETLSARIAHEAQHAASVLLDECDQVSQDVILQTLRRHLTGKPRLRFIICSRATPHALFCDPFLRALSLYMPTQPGVPAWDHLVRPTDMDWLEVSAFGQGRVYCNGRLITNWAGALPRSLFFFLIDRQMVERDVIFETFWPTLSKADATNVFHVTKRKIAEVLGLGPDRGLTQFDGHYYKLNDSITLSYDVTDFIARHTESLSSEHPSDALHASVTAYKGDFLAGIDMPWAEARRQELRLMNAELLASIARVHELAGNSAKAYVALLRAIRLMPGQQEWVFKAIQLARKRQAHREGIILYERLRQHLSSAGAANPVNEALASLYDQLMAAAH